MTVILKIWTKARRKLKWLYFDPFSESSSALQIYNKYYLFLLAIDWTMRRTTEGTRDGIQWTLTQQLDDLDYADDLALLSHSRVQVANKTKNLERFAASIGLRINIDKTKIMKINTRSTEPVKAGGREIEELTSFTYFGSNVDTLGGTDENVRIRISKAKAAFNILKKVRRSREINTNTKLRIFNSNVKSVLLYGSETWKTSHIIKQRVQSFINKCLRQILHIFWPNTIRNEELWQQTHQMRPSEEIKKRKWNWIGHTLRKDESNITRQALRWNPPGKRKRGRPRNTWRRTWEDEMKRAGLDWHPLIHEARSRHGWRAFVQGLCTEGSRKGLSNYYICTRNN